MSLLFYTVSRFVIAFLPRSKHLLISWLQSQSEGFRVAQMVKRLPAMWETWVRSLGREDPLEKEMASHSSTLAWKIPWMEESGGLQSMVSQRVRHDSDFTFTFRKYLLFCFTSQSYLKTVPGALPGSLLCCGPIKVSRMRGLPPL